MEKEQIVEWLESDVAQYFRELLQKNINAAADDNMECFFPCDPQRTQEGRVECVARGAVFQMLLDAFVDKDLESLVVEEEE